MGVPGNANALLLRSAAAAGGYQVSRSIRLNSADSAHLSRTPASAGNRRTWTFSCWVKRAELNTFQSLFCCIASNLSHYLQFTFESDNCLLLYDSVATAGVALKTTQVFRDSSAWYHLVLQYNTTDATASNKVKLYVNGSEITQFSTDNRSSLTSDSSVNRAEQHSISGRQPYSTNYFGGYLADIHFIDGQALTPSSFAETNATTGQWVPKTYTGSYGTNGFQLKFADNSNNTATTLGKDTSGNGNNFSPSNFSVTAGAGNDSLVDTPTSYGTDDFLGGSVRGNYATFNPTESSTSGTKTLTNGNLDALLADANAARLTIPPIQPSGKYQWEITIGSKTATYYQMGLNLLSMVYATGDLHATFRSDGNLSNTLSGSWSGTGVSYTSGDIITVTYDNATNACAFYKNGVYSATFTVSGTPQASLNFGVFYGGSGNTNYTLNTGQRPFAYPVSGFKALCDTNLPAPVVAQPSTVMDVKLYTGNGSSQAITGLGFSPDFVWIKNRSATASHILNDIVRGAGRNIFSDQTAAENAGGGSVGDLFTSFDTTGFTVNQTYAGSSSNGTNANTNSYVAWVWDAGSSTVTNTQGSITSSVRANASAGFSVVSWSANNTANQSIGHGLGVTPAFIIHKNRTTAGNWNCWFTGFSNDEYINLNGTGAKASTGGGLWYQTPTSSLFYIGFTGSAINNSTDAIISYCFAPVAGYGNGLSYVGNGSTDGPFCYLGFLPKLILIKCSSTTGNWVLLDTSREGYNVDNDPLFPNLSDAEATTDLLDITSNGFKIRSTNADVNANAATYIVYAWASNPFQYSRAR